MASNDKFGAGLGIGAAIGFFVGLLTRKPKSLNLTSEAVPDAGSVTAVDVSTDGTNMLIESLRGISAAGDGADILKIQVLGLERAKLVAMRGTKGVNRDEPTRFIRFMDMTNDHLENTLKFGKNVSGDEKRIIESILEDRLAAAGAATADPVAYDDDEDVTEDTHV